MNTSKPRKPAFGDAPEALDPVDMVRAGSIIVSVMDTGVLLMAKIHQTAFGLESIRVDDRIRTNFFPEQFLTTRVYALPFRFISPSTIPFLSLSSHELRTRKIIAFVDFNLSLTRQAFELAGFSNPPLNNFKNTIDGLRLIPVNSVAFETSMPIK